MKSSITLAVVLLMGTTAQADTTRQFFCTSPFHKTATSRLLTLVYDPAKKEGFGVQSIEWAILKMDEASQKLKIDRNLKTQLIDHVKADGLPIAFTPTFAGGFTRVRALDPTTQINSEILIQTERMVSSDLENGISWAQEIQPTLGDRGDSDFLVKVYRWSCSQI